MKTSVSVGITTVIGWLVFVGGLIPILVKLLEEGSSASSLGGPERYAAIISIVSLAVTNIGRYWQAHEQIRVGSQGARRGLDS